MVGSPLIGTGVLIVGGARFEGANYRIDVLRVGNSRLVARGVLKPPKGAVAACVEAFNAGSASLQLDSGHVLEIVPSSFAAQSAATAFEFTVSGSVPGFGL